MILLTEERREERLRTSTTLTVSCHEKKEYQRNCHLRGVLLDTWVYVTLVKGPRDPERDVSEVDGRSNGDSPGLPPTGASFERS